MAHPLALAPSPAAERMRRLRERRARGVRHVVQAEVDDALLEFLERTGLVDRAEADNPSAVAFGLWMLLNEVVENHRIKETLLRRNIRPGADVESPN